MKKGIIVTVAVLVTLLILTPLLLIPVVAFTTPPQYSDTFYGALNEKFDRLENLDGKRIVVVGGSSVAFGLDSALLEQATGYEVVNFGLYADLGTKIMLDLSRDHIREDDIVILAPELDEQTLSLYFNGLSALKALDDNPSMIFDLEGENLYDVWGSLWKFTQEKRGYAKNGAPNPEGVYNAKNFNRYGDIDKTLFPRYNNIMGQGYDMSHPVVLDQSIYSSDFVDYLNDYISDIEKVGASVYYTFCPVNDLSVVYDSESLMTKEEQLDALSANLLSWLKTKLSCEILGTPKDAVMEHIYFYDSNFHLNDGGVLLHTVRLAEEIIREEGLADTFLAEDVTAMTGYTFREGDFVFRRLEDGTLMLCDVVGTSRRLNSIVLPATARGMTVSTLSESALKQCKLLAYLVFPAGESYRHVLYHESDTYFQGLKGLNQFTFFGNPPETFPPASQLPEQKVCTVHPDVYDDFVASPLMAELFGGEIGRYPYSFDVAQEMVQIKLDTLKNFVPETKADDYLIYTSQPDGTWAVSGVTALGDSMTVLVIPQTFGEEENIITAIAPHAFSGTKHVKGIVIGADSYIVECQNYLFINSSVRALYLYMEPENFTVTVAIEMMSGAAEDFKLYVYENDRLNNYKTNYGWSAFTNDGYYELNTIAEDEIVDYASSNLTKTTRSPLTVTLLVTVGCLAVGAALWFGVDFFTKKKTAAKQD